MKEETKAEAGPEAANPESAKAEGYKPAVPPAEMDVD